MSRPFKGCCTHLLGLAVCWAHNWHPLCPRCAAMYAARGSAELLRFRNFMAGAL